MRRTASRSLGTIFGAFEDAYIYLVLTLRSPDYKQLRILRELFPRVPILALSATCPPRVLQDLRSILQLPEICDGNSEFCLTSRE